MEDVPSSKCDWGIDPTSWVGVPHWHLRGGDTRRMVGPAVASPGSSVVAPTLPAVPTHPRACGTLGATGAARHSLCFLLLSQELERWSLGLFSSWKGNISEYSCSFSGFTLLFDLGQTTVPHRWLLEPIKNCMQEGLLCESEDTETLSVPSFNNLY